ncbi:hypothetical protein ACG7TL_006824 [Trametes sanguinea]
MPVATTDRERYLETLGLTAEDLNEDAVRVAYKKLALRWHPDRHNADPEEAKQKFIEVNEAYKALVEECKKKNKRKLWRRDTSASQRRPFWASSTPSAASTSSSQASCGTEHAEKHSGSHKQDQASRSHSDNDPSRKKDRTNAPHPAAPKSAHPRSKPSNHHRDHHRHHHRDRDSDSDSSSEAGSAHAHDHFTHDRAKTKKSASLGEDDYEFIDLGTPLKPLRSPRSFTASTKDWIFPLHLTLEDLYFGAVHRYRITRTLRPSPTAMTQHGKGSNATGTGERRQTVQIDVRVAPGWTTGTRIRVPRVGNQRADGSFQDIVFVVAEAPHPRFVRRGDDLILHVHVPWMDAHTRPYPSGDVRVDTDHLCDPRVGWAHGEAGHHVPYRFGRGALNPLHHVHGHEHGSPRGQPREVGDEVYVLGINGEEYTIPIPRTLVEAADGTRIYGAGMPIRKNGCVVGMGDMVIRWEFVFPESDKMQRSRWQTLKDAMHIKLPL